MSNRAPTSGSRINGPGSDDALERLFERHRLPLWRLGLRMSEDPDTAADLVQETFVRAITNGVPADPEEVEPWLVRILVNLCRDLYKWRQVRERHAGTVEAMTVSRSTAADPESQAVASVTVRRALRALAPRRRAVLVLHDLEGVGPERVGELLGLRPATVRWHLAAARREIKAAIGGEEP